MHIFDFLSYRKYLKHALQASGRRSGYKTQAAEAMGVQPAFLSRVLAGQAELSLEQADKLSQFLGHGKEEHHYLLLLLQYERAGSTSLKSYFRQQLDREKHKRGLVSEQIQAKTHISPEAESRYYSSWIYAAVHVLISIERLQTAAALSQALSLPQNLVADVLHFLASNGLASVNHDRYSTGPVRMHLRQDSDHILRHHSNWRLKSIESLSQPINEDIRYSAVVTLDEECVSRLRPILVENLKQIIAEIEPSPAKTAYVYNLDFFRLLK